MTDINHFNLIGRLTRDAHISEVGSTKKADLSLAVNRSVKKGDNWEDDVSYFDVVIWSPSAYLIKSLTKGTQIACDGYMHQERWEKDGKKNSKVSFVATSTQLLLSTQKTSDNSDSNSTSDIPF